jgi:hypothetical protein
MAGYSGTPLAKKLGIKSGHRVGVFGAPTGFEKTLEPMPEDVTLVTQARGSFDVIVLFVHRHSELRRRFAKLAPRIVANGGIWVGWPKKTSPIPTDLAFDRVQHTGLDTGLVDNKVCAIDDDYSGLRFVVRLENRDDWPPG